MVLLFPEQFVSSDSDIGISVTAGTRSVLSLWNRQKRERTRPPTLVLETEGKTRLYTAADKPHLIR